MKKTILLILTCLITSPIISQNNSSIPAQGMVLYYPFSGSANDSSGNGFNGVVAGASLTTDRFGVANSAYSFDGHTSVIRCGDILDSVFSAPVAKFSVSGWADTRVFGSFQTGGGFIVGKNAGGTYGPYQWSVSHIGGLIIGGVFSDTAQQNYVELSCPMATNQWFHFVLVFDGSLPEMQRVKLFINGQSSNTAVYQHVGTLGTTTTNSAQNLSIGATYTANNPESPDDFYDGNIDDIRIYNWALDSTTIQSLYHEKGWPLSIKPGLVAYYPFNGNVNDSSGNGNNGINSGATLTTDRFGKSNSACHFAGGASIGIPELFPDTVLAFTFAAWVMKDSMDYNTHEILYKGLDQGEASIGITKTTDGTVVGFGVNIETGVYGAQNWFYVNAPDTLRAKTYYFLVGRYVKGQKVDFFINGTLIGSSSVPILPLAKWPGHSYSAIGLQPQFPTTTGWNGVIDDIRVYNQALDSTTIQSLYHEGGWQLLSSQPKLELFYPFSGNANDSSGNGFNGAVAGATLTTDRFGVANSAYSFNGSTSIIRCGDILDSVFCAPVAKFSVSGWAMTRTFGSFSGGGGFIVGKNGGGTLGPYQWNVSHDDGLLYGAVLSDTLAKNYVALTIPMTKNQWFHFVLVFDGSLPEMQRVKLYVNGQSSNASVYQHVGTLGTTTVNSMQNLSIGGTQDVNHPEFPGDYYDGNVDDIRIYNWALDSTTIQSLYHEGGWPLPSEPGLVAYYPFNGNANDSSGNGYNGTVAGATLTTDRFGLNNGAYRFNGTSSVIRCGDILDSVFSAPIAKFSVSGWAKTNSYKTLQQDGGYMLGKNAGGAGPYQWGLGHYQGLVLATIFSDTNGLTNYMGVASPMTTNQWFHFVYIFDGSQPELQRLKLYINGQSSNDSLLWHVGTIGTTTVNTGQQFTFGASHARNNPLSLANFYDGTLDDIRIYNRVLSDQEIQSLYHAGGWPLSSKPGLVAYYPFNSNANDSSGNGNNGIDSGATLTTDRFGKSNSAYHFTGGASILVPELFPDSCSAFTFAAWVKEDSKDNGEHVIIYKGIQQGEASLVITPGILGFGVNLYIPGTSTSTQNWYPANTPDTLRTNTYYFLVGRYIKGQKVDLSINGIVVSSLAVPNLNLVSNPLGSSSAIGAHTWTNSSPSYGWNGIIDDIRVYNRALDSATIQSLYHEGGWNGQPNGGIVSAGLMAWYPFNGTASDSSGNGNNGTNNGATLTTDRFGHPGSALRFNGVNNDVAFNSVPITAIDNFSISMWMNADTLPQTCSMVQIGNDDGSNPSISNGYGIGISDGSISYSSGSVLSCILSGTNDVYNSGYSYASSHGWHHIILVRSGGISSFYVDDVKTANTSTSIPKIPTQFFIGSQNGLRFFKGSLDDIRIYNRVLNRAEMDSLYHEGGWQVEGVTQVRGDIPSDFELASNYPNPFNPSTTIRFGVPVQSQVKIEIFNILGQGVTELVNTEVGPGYFEKVWQANCASGIYFYRIEAISLSDPSKRFVAVRKMLLMK